MQLDQVIQGNSAATEEMSAASEELSEQAEQLLRTASFFKIKGGDDLLSRNNARTKSSKNSRSASSKLTSLKATKGVEISLEDSDSPSDSDFERAA